MNYLLEYGLTEDDLHKIEEANDSAVIRNVSLNKHNVIEVVNYLKEIGVSDLAIKELFIHQIGIFMRTKDEIANVFDEYEMESIIKSLNYDVNTVDLIEFS